MKGHNYKNISLSPEELFNKVFDDEQLHEYIRSKADKRLRAKIASARHDRNTMVLDSKRKFLEAVGFEMVAGERWSMKKSTK